MRSRRRSGRSRVIAVSIVVDFFRARLLYRVAAETSSEALEADALHFGSDMWSSIAVLIGLGAVALGYPWADSAAAVIVAIFICIAGWRLGRRTIDTLTDTAPTGVGGQGPRDRDRAFRAWSRSIACGCGRPATSLFVDLDIAVSRTLPLDRVAAIKERIEAAVRDAIPHRRNHRQHRAARARRRERDGARDGDRAQSRARRSPRHRACHRRPSCRSRSISKSTAACRSPRAHEIADELEAALRDELGPERRGRNPYRAAADPRDWPAAMRRPSASTQVQAALAELAASSAAVRDVHDVRVRETADGEIVNFHCHVDPALTVTRRPREGRRAGARAACAVRRHQARDRPRRAAAVNRLTS